MKWNKPKNFFPEIAFLAVLNFFPVQKYIFGDFWSCKKWILVIKKTSWNWFIWFHEIFGLDLLKFFGSKLLFCKCFSCVVFGQGTLILKLSNCFSEASDEFKDEKEDMIIKSENNSIAWSSEDDVPPQIIIQNKSSKKLEPLLQPLKYKSPTKE